MRGVYLRGKTYWLRYTVNGKRIFESAETNDRKSADLILKKRLVEIHEGKYFGKVKAIRTTISEAVEQYLTVYAKERKSTWWADEIMLRKYQEFMDHETFIQDIDRLSIDRFQADLLAQRLSKARVNRYIACLKTFFNKQIEWGKLSSNPVKGVKMYPEEMRTRYLELGQIQILLDECSKRLRPIVLTALLTGLRKSDILGLRWDNIDFETRILHLNQKKTKGALATHLSEAMVELLQGIQRSPDCPYVFQEGGEPISRFGWIRSEFEAAVKRAGLVDLKFHDTRHTFATQQRFLGRDITVIKELLGHRSIKMTMRYAHIGPNELKDAVNDLGQKITRKIQNRDNSNFQVLPIPEKT